DGIRDWSVTGVQTCALPIFRVRASVHAVRERQSRPAVERRGPKRGRGRRRIYVGCVDRGAAHTENDELGDRFQGRRARDAIRSRSEERRVGREGRGGGAEG